jgi:dihydroorotate dehydrogenase electron transfer subunit
VSGREHRGTICLEQAEILHQRSFPGNQFILRVRAPAAARRALPGTFGHLTCHPAVPLRRPLSIMRADPGEGWLEFLYKPLGRGLAALAARTEGETLSLLAPIGRGFITGLMRTPLASPSLVTTIAGTMATGCMMEFTRLDRLCLELQ